MYAYDNNGLELTPVANSLNAYRLTAVDMTEKKYAAYAASKPRRKNDWSMHTIGLYKDPRDAAFVAQEFAKLHDKVAVRQMITDNTFIDIVRAFRETIEIPVWKFDPEGLSFDDILGGKYKTNYVNNAKDAIIEALRVFQKKTPSLAEGKILLQKVEAMVKSGLNYRQAAHSVIVDVK